MRQQPTHHPDEALLFGYAGGSLNEASALVLATHMTFCPNCRQVVGDLEVVGGALLEELEPEPLAAGSFDALMALINADSMPKAGTAVARRIVPANPLIPEPLRRYVGDDLSRLGWRSPMPGIQVADVPMDGREDGALVQLIRMGGGRTVPRHAHEGLELVVVLEGGFTDEYGHYLLGDVAMNDSRADHRPVADAEGCLCLAVNMARAHLAGPMGRMLTVFVPR